MAKHHQKNATGHKSGVKGKLFVKRKIHLVDKFVFPRELKAKTGN